MAKKKQAAEVAVIENPKLNELIEKSGVELTKAEAHVSAFHPFLADLAELSRPLAALDKKNPTAEHAKTARETRLKIVKIRTGSEAIKNDRKALLLAEGNLIQSAFNLVKDACILTESEYEEIEKHQEREEAKKREELKASRIALLLPYETDIEYIPLDSMDEDRFQQFLAKEKETFEAVQAKRKQDELDRLAAAEEAEKVRLAEIEAEIVRKEEMEAELEKARKAEALRSKRSAELRLYIAFVKDYDSIIALEEAEYRKELAEIKKEAELKWEADRKAAELQQAKEKELAELKAKEEAASRAAEEEKKRQAEEEKKKAQAIADAAKAPDQEKVRIFFNSFKEIKFPDLTSEPGKLMASRVNEALEVVKQLIIADSSTLL
jgi:hypothetical protein